MTIEEIKKIREELARITKWPWRCDEYRHNDDNSFMWWQIHKGTTSDYGGDDCVANTWLNVASVEEKEGLHDAIFIAKSPERIAALLDEVERLKKPGDCPFCQGTGAWEHKHSHELLRDLRAKLKVAEDALEKYAKMEEDRELESDGAIMPHLEVKGWPGCLLLIVMFGLAAWKVFEILMGG